MATPANFLRFPWRERLLFPEAVWRLTDAARVVKRVPFAKLEQTLADPSNHGDPTEEQVTAARAVCRVVRSAARHLPFECACLQQALAARAMLRRRNIPSIIHIGIAKGQGEQADPGLDSHAWLTVGEAVLTGKEGHERFNVIVRL